MMCFRVFCSIFLFVANPYVIETAASHCWSIAMGRTGTSVEGACHTLRRGAKARDGIQVRLMPVTEFGKGIRAPSVLELELRLGNIPRRKLPWTHWLTPLQELRVPTVCQGSWELGFVEVEAPKWFAEGACRWSPLVPPPIFSYFLWFLISLDGDMIW